MTYRIELEGLSDAERADVENLLTANGLSFRVYLEM